MITLELISKFFSIISLLIALVFCYLTLMDFKGRKRLAAPAIDLSVGLGMVVLFSGISWVLRWG
jgi:hypothetical protein